MKVRFIEYCGEIYIVIGISYDSNIDPPEAFHCVPLEHSITRSMITYLHIMSIPVSQAVEITDIKRIRALLVLYGE